jgi:dTDP-4-dehydrorhamnose 3,5-epimerase
MALTCHQTDLDGVFLLETPVFRDGRGYFTEIYSEKALAACGIAQRFVQDNLSQSANGTLRGMHYQIEPHAQGKLVRVLKGKVFDAVVDLRRRSPTFGLWAGWTLSADESRALWIPPGFAHGFMALADETLLFYKCTAGYAPEAERSFSYKDPAVGIEWPAEPVYVSPKDAAAPAFAHAEHDFV